MYIDKYMYPWRNWRTIPLNLCVIPFHLLFALRISETGGKKSESDSGRKYKWKNREILMNTGYQNEVANARRDKTGSCWATNEGEWVTPTSEWSLHVHYSKKHRLLVITIENCRVMWLQSFFLSSWRVRSPDPHRRVGRGTWLGRNSC